MPVSFAFRLVLLCALFPGTGRLDAAELLESVAARQPVRLAGVVTYLRDATDGINFILDDGTGGVMVYPELRPSGLQPGQRVTVEGVTQKDRLLLSISTTNVLFGPMAELPVPLPATLPEVLAGKFDGRFVEVEETVRVVRVESPQLKPQRLALDLGARSQRLTAWISRWEGSEARFTSGARARLRGMAIRAEASTEALRRGLVQTDD